MKIMAVLNALRSPAFQAELGIGSSTGSSSPRDSETGYQMASETGSISSSMSGGSHDHHPDMPPPPPAPSWSQSDTMPRDYNVSMNAFVVVVSKRKFVILVAATLSLCCGCDRFSLDRLPGGRAAEIDPIEFEYVT